MALLLYKWLAITLLTLSAPAAIKPVPAAPAAVTEVRHPFYVSVTEINQNRDTKSLEITCKVFADDLEDILKKNYKTTVDLTAQSQQAQNNRLVSDYFTRRLGLSIDGKPGRLAFVGFEKDSESAFCYFEVPNVPALNTLQVSNSILQDLSTEQINIMHVTVNGTRKSYKLDYPHKEATFSF